MLKVILISGYKRSGKDWVSDELNERIKGSLVLAFAEPIKDILATALSLSKNTFDELKNISAPIHTTDFRSLIQRFGNEAMKKQFGEDVWSNLLISKLPTSGVVIVSDWRFNIEYEKICEVADEVTTVRVLDHNLTAGTHASEHELDNFSFDVELNNTAKSDYILRGIDYLAKRF